MIIVEVTELVTYRVVLPAGTENPEDTAVDAVCNSEDPWTEFGGTLTERFTEIVAG